MQSPNSTLLSLDDRFWLNLQYKLTRLAKELVYGNSISSWKYQAREVVEDIVGETLVRTLEYVRHTEKIGAQPIRSIEALAIVIARRYFIDLTRKDKRLLPLSQLLETPWGTKREYYTIDYMERVECRLFYNEFFTLLTREIKGLPKKRQRAFLIMMAGIASKGQLHELLEHALQQEDIALADYCYPTSKE